MLVYTKRFCWLLICTTSDLHWTSSTFFCRSGLAPAASSLSTIGRWPLKAADMRAVQPVWEESEGQQKCVSVLALDCQEGQKWCTMHTNIRLSEHFNLTPLESTSLSMCILSLNGPGVHWVLIRHLVSHFTCTFLAVMTDIQLPFWPFPLGLSTPRNQLQYNLRTK